MIVRNFLLGVGFLLLAGVQCRRVERHQQLGLEPDYASRRRIRDVEAEDETSDARFIETHASASAGAISENMDAPVSEEDVEAKAVKAKLLMQAESLGISNAEEYAEKVVQQAQEQGKVRFEGLLYLLAIGCLIHAVTIRTQSPMVS